MSDTPPLLSIPAAARAAQVPERSLYRAVEAGEVPSTVTDGAKLLVLPDVVAWRDRRAAARPPPLPSAPPAVDAPAVAPEAPATALPPPAATVGNPAAATGGRTPGNAPVHTSDGALASKLFAAFDQGAAPADLVVTEQLSPGVVAAYFRQYQELRAVGGGDRKSLAERVTALEAGLRALGEALEQATWGGVITGEVGDLKRKVEEIVAQVASLPVPRREQFTCGCGNRGWVGAVVRCTVCHRETTWGFTPPKT